MLTHNNMLDAFRASLRAWGGMGSQIYGIEDYLLRRAAPSDAVSPNHAPPNYRADMAEWPQVASTIGVFTNAYFVQEIDRLFEGPGDIRWAVDTLRSPGPILLLLSLILVARENGVGVECEWTHPTINQPLFSRLGASYRATMLISIRQVIADCLPDFLIRLTGVETVRDPDLQDRFIDRRVERSVVVQCDRERSQPRSNADLESDMFIQDRGYPLFQFSSADVLHDCFSCAVKVFRALNNSEIVTDETPQA